MKPETRKSMARVGWTSIALGLALQTVWADPEPGSPFHQFKVVAAKTLAKQRGGFVGAEGLQLQLRLNLSQMVYINNQLVSSVQANLADIRANTTAQLNQVREDILTQAQAVRTEAQALGDSLTNAAPGTGGTQASGSSPVTIETKAPSSAPTQTPTAASTGQEAVASSAGSKTTGLPFAQPSSLPTQTPPAASTRQDAIASAGSATANLPANQPPVNATPTSTNTSTGTANGTTGSSSVVVIQNGPGNMVDTSSLKDFRGGALTIVQNSLNNQAIRNVMSVDATISGMRNLRTADILRAVNLQLRGAGR